MLNRGPGNLQRGGTEIEREVVLGCPLGYRGRAGVTCPAGTDNHLSSSHFHSPSVPMTGATMPPSSVCSSDELAYWSHRQRLSPARDAQTAAAKHCVSGTGEGNPDGPAVSLRNNEQEGL